MTTHYLLAKLKNRFLISAKVLSGRYTHEKIEGINLIAKYSPLKIVNVDSKGKFMWIELLSEAHNKKIYIMNNFGMTGEWRFKKNEHSRIMFVIKNQDLSKVYHLYYNDQRNFGIIKITEQFQDIEKKLGTLGDDYLKTDFDQNSFYQKFMEFLNSKENHKKMNLYTLLTSQERKKGLGSGLGNYLTPEILYRAKLSPFRTLDSLSKEDIHNLANSILYTVKLCYVNNKIGYMASFGDYIDRHKEGIKKGKYPNYHPQVDVDDKEFKFQVYQQKTDPSGNLVKSNIKSKSDRTIHWVPQVQK